MHIEHRKKRITQFAFFLFTIVVGIFFCCKGATDEDDEPETIVVMTDYNSLDYFYADDTIQGFQYEIVSVLCDSLNLTPKWVLENDMQKSISALNNGDVEILARNIPITTQLREKIDFSYPIIKTSQVLVQRKKEFNNDSKPIRNQLDLAGKTIHLPENSPNILRLRNLADEIADTITIKSVPNYDAEQLVMMVAHGDIDFTVCDKLIAQECASRMEEIDIRTAISFSQLQAWGLNVDDDLKARIDTFLSNFIQTKQYREIYRKYVK